MFALFFSLYYAMFAGTFRSINPATISAMCKDGINAIGSFLTSLFNNVDTPMSTLGDVLFSNDTAYGNPTWISVVSFILALITSIGIVVMAVKGIKRIFSVFFYGVR